MDNDLTKEEVGKNESRLKEQMNGWSNKGKMLQRMRTERTDEQ